MTSKLKVGYGLDPDTDIGPLISKSAKSRVTDIITECIAQGGTCELDGRDVTVKGNGPVTNFIIYIIKY